MQSISCFIFCCSFMISLSSSSLSFLNTSSLLGTNKNSSPRLDQQTADTQDVPAQDFFVKPDASFGSFADQYSTSYPSDLKVWEAIPVVDVNSQLAPYLQPPNSDVSNLVNYEYMIDSYRPLENEAPTLEQEPTYTKPDLGSFLSALQGLKSQFPLRHKLKKHLNHGLFGKHKGFPLLEAGAYVGDLTHHFANSLYQKHIPQFSPIPLSIANLEVSDPYGLEVSVFKSILVPLAGVALLGAAATAMVVTNPFIWSLPFTLLLGPTSFGHLSHFFGRRRRRDVHSEPNNRTISNDVIVKKIEEIKILDDFLRKSSKAEEVIMQEKKVLATYLMTQAICIERLVCALHQPKLPEIMAQQNRVMSIVTKEILENEFVPQIIHDNILRARQVGIASGNCQTFFCYPLNYHRL